MPEEVVNANSGNAVLQSFSPFPNKLNWLLITFPIALWAGFFSHNATLAFATSMVAIMPLAFLMGKATEEIALRYSDSIGGLLNATFGNAVEIIIATLAIITAYRSPEVADTMITVVKASLIGSILGNLLLVLGLALLWGGINHSEQKFSTDANSSNGSLLMLAVMALIIPFTLDIAGGSPNAVLDLSRYAAIVLLLIYGLALIFQLKTHSYLYESTHEQEGHEEPTMSVKDAWTLLILATIFVGVMAEILVHSIDAAASSWGLPELFIGIILLPFFGNAAEHFSAVLVAGKNKMDLSLGIAIGSSVQIAVFVAPLMVVFAWVMGVELSMDFGILETIVTFVSILIANMILSDGKSNWLEGAMLLACYVILGIAFFQLG